MPDTIVALATPTGRSGIGVVRLSGSYSVAILRRLLNDDAFQPQPRHAHLASLVDPQTRETIDSAVVTYFKAPHSFTGEEVVEISCHGSPVLLRQVIDICLGEGGRMADPGEFTLRALANGRIDLAEAEAIRDLIDAQTTAAARQAVRQMRGEFSDRLKPLKDDLLDVIVVLESSLEFVEDDLPAMQIESVRNKLIANRDSIAQLAETFTVGHLIRDGLRVAIVGRPNVGKSSLFNALLGSDRAIVTDIAGTTRDQLHERFVVDGIPISLIDTAGLRETEDTVEKIGVERSRKTMADADMVVVMLDASEEITGEDHALLDSVKDLTFLVAINKIDKQPSWDIDHVAASDNSQLAGVRDKLVPISAKTGDGLDELRHALVHSFGVEDANTSGFLVTDARHHDLLIRARDEVDESLANLDAKMSEEITLVGLHNALRYLGEITGETTTEDILTRIFSTFCIGK
ncbi:MAG TPA: tRNA uridine-5-carboxymethylaminomethyl(34) synthesis GTPase MnmE [Pyrinomonadaceae bacterium]|nr:tRNA uridine-5-carboxymethylaminomethyl(34) synthesis GTPase MnmE [Pyrinomonadaceae bacterium]